MDRRQFLATSAAMALAGTSASAEEFSPKPGMWRTFEIITRVDVPEPQAGLKAWLPLPSITASDWVKPGDNAWTGNAQMMKAQTLGRYGGNALAVAWHDGTDKPWVEVKSTVATQDRAIDLKGRGQARKLSASERHLFTAPTRLIPTDGIVRETALKITAGQTTDLARVTALYEWVVANTFRDAATRGCGIGDIKNMLTTGFLGGKCADINALFVGMARSVGVPARDLYGIRTAPSRFGYKALGAGSANITKSQHCRAEVFLENYGWVPIDPADVRKVALEEPPGNLPLDDAKVAAAHRTLFGAWEGNWIPFNDSHDVTLPGSVHEPVAFLMYPQAETVQARFDCLNADTFRYTITVREI